MLFDIAAIVTRLSQIVPRDFRLVQSCDGVVHIALGAEQLATIDLRESLKRGSWEGALWDLLSFVQDQIVMETRHPWPEWEGHLAIPQIREENGRCVVWYGSPLVVILRVGTFESVSRTKPAESIEE